MSHARKQILRWTLSVLMGLFAASSALAAPARPPGPSPGPPSAPSQFVGVRGTTFTLHGKPFHFLGANVGVLHGPTERRGYRRTLAAAKADGLRVVRIWALGEGARKTSPWIKRWHVFRTGPRGWLPTAPRHLDKVLAHAKRLGLRVMLTLANNWAAYGGVPMYLRWAGLGIKKYGALDRFFTNKRTQGWFRQHVLRLVNRRSSVTGTRYGDDPTIMAWELFNESRSTPGGFAARRRLIRRTASLIRTHAPEQLVSSGVTEYHTLPLRQEWLKLCRLREVDFCDAHLYPGESWRLRQGRDLDDILDDRVQLAHHIARKPIVFGEFAFARSIVKRKRLRRRSQRYWVGRFLRRIHFNGAAGAMIWLYLPHSKAKRKYPVWVDHKQSLPLRRTLRRWAKRFRRGPPRRINPRLGARHGTKPLFKTQITVKRTPPRHRWKPLLATGTGTGTAPLRRRVEIPVMDFRRARFGDVGYYGAGWIEHVYGDGHGYIEYRVPRLRSRRKITTLALVLRLSSEFPGTTAPPTGVSRVEIKLSGRVVARLLVAPDDGKGRLQRLVLRDPKLLKQLRRKSLTLRLEVPWGKQARGLCIYGRLGVQGVLRKYKPRGFVGPLRLTATLASNR